MKFIKMFLVIIASFIISCDVKAKSVAKECTYHYAYSLAGWYAGLKVNIYSDNSSKAWITSFNGKELNNEEDIQNWADLKETYKSDGKCPDFAVIKYAGGINGASVWLYNTEEEANKQYEDNGSNGEKWHVATSNEYVAPEDKAKMYYEAMQKHTEHINSEYQSYSLESCIEPDKVITRIGKCNDIYSALDTYMYSAKNEVESFIREGYIQKDDQRTIDFYDALEHAQARWDEVKKELDAEQKKIDQEMGLIDPSLELNKGDDTDNGDKVNNCSGFLGKEFKGFLQKTFDLIQLIGPILALVLGMVDLVKAIGSGEDDAKKKAFKNVGRRLGASVALYLIPALLTLVLSLVDIISGSTCGIK